MPTHLRKSATFCLVTLLICVSLISLRKAVRARERVVKDKATPSQTLVVKKDEAGEKPKAVLPDEKITYTKHVAGILNKHCVECHRVGEVGPFTLQSFDDASKRAEFIRDITAERRLPPYHADPDYGNFRDARRLSETELAIIDAWVRSGAPEGDKADLPEPPKFVDGWTLGEPDLILKMNDDFEIPAESRDIYQCFVIPTGLTEDTYITAVEFRPGNRKVVHHAIMYLDDSGAARIKDAADPTQGYRSFGGPGFVPTGGLGGWAPGVAAQRLPDDFGKVIKANSDLALQLHYHPTGKVEKDRSQLGIYFAKKKPKNLVTGIAMFNPSIRIPAGQSDYTLETKITLPCDVRALGIWPHMHLLGREMKVVATLPDGTERPMLWVKDWDFNWQDGYVYAESPLLPKGTTIQMTARYDNSKYNPVNPNSPPKLVHYGEGTNDEMCLCTILVYPVDPSEMRKLFTIPFARLGAALGGGSLPDGPSDSLRKAFKGLFQ